MEALLKELHKAGIHSIKSNHSIILETMDTELQHALEIDALIITLINKVDEQTHNTVRLQCPLKLLHKMSSVREHMTIEGERVIYLRSLADAIAIPDLSFEVWPVTGRRSIAFLAETMQSSYQDANEFLAQMREELPAQADHMFTVYFVKDEPAGVVFPHIEPNTDREGRMFWIGMYPKFKGKGLGKNLHQIGLYRLQKEFAARIYIGSTTKDNFAMRSIMASNRCKEKMTVISLNYSKNT